MTRQARWEDLNTRLERKETRREILVCLALVLMMLIMLLLRTDHHLRKLEEAIERILWARKRGIRLVLVSMIRLLDLRDRISLLERRETWIRTQEYLELEPITQTIQ